MTDWTGEGRSSAAIFREMALRGYADHSPSYRAVALAVADDPETCARLDALPPDKRQPNLLLAAVRLLGGPVDVPATFLAWTTEHWDRVGAVVLSHRTQTNEPRRCSALLPVLGGLAGPLALIEVGASAGLGLLPDRYAYRYTWANGSEVAVGDSPVTVPCAASGPVPVPRALPDVVWRRGLDLHPLDVTDDDDARWLESLVWPEQTERFATLRAALDLARHDPPTVVTGDLLTDLAALVHDAPVDATVVVHHSAVLAYLGPEDRRRFVASLADLGRDVVWVANEAPGMVVDHERDERGRFLLSVDGRPVAWAGQHGHTLDWIGR